MRWSDNKQYTATVLAFGDRKSVEKAERNHTAHSEDENSINTANKNPENCSSDSKTSRQEKNETIKTSVLAKDH